MVSLADRIKNVHPNALKRVRPNAKYVTDRLQEYTIERDRLGLYYVKAYHGGPVGKECQGKFQTFRECEAALIRYLKRTNKFGRAIWPEQKQPNSTEPS